MWKEGWEGRGDVECFMRELERILPSSAVPFPHYHLHPIQVTKRLAMTRLQPEQSSNQREYNQKQRVDI